MIFTKFWLFFDTIIKNKTRKTVTEILGKSLTKLFIKTSRSKYSWWHDLWLLWVTFSQGWTVPKSRLVGGLPYLPGFILPLPTKYTFQETQNKKKKCVSLEIRNAMYLVRDYHSIQVIQLNLVVTNIITTSFTVQS